MQEYFCAVFICRQSAEKKEKIYRKLLETNRGFETRFGCDYWISLCVELDECLVYEYYTKPILQSSLGKLFKGGDLVYNIHTYFVEATLCHFVDEDALPMSGLSVRLFMIWIYYLLPHMLCWK